MTKRSHSEHQHNEEAQTPSSMLDAMKQSRSSGWRRFDRRYRPWLMRKFIRQGERIERAEDVTQDTMLEVARRITDFSPRRTGSFRAWLSRIAHSRLVDRKRRDRRVLEYYLQSQSVSEIPAVAESLTPQLSTRRQLLYQEMMRRLNKRFSNRDIKIVFRYLVNEEAPEAIAADYLITPNAVYLVKSRVLKQIRREL